MTSGAVGTDDALPEIVFDAPLPGLEDLTRFVLVRLDEVGALFSLRSLQSPGTRLVVVAPWVVDGDYAPVLDDDTCAHLGLVESADAVLLLVVNPGASLPESTVNLLAPLVVHARTGRAAQVVLTGTDLPVRAPLVAA